MNILSEVNLDQPSVLTGLRKVFQTYSSTAAPMTWLLCGNFTSRAALSGTDIDSIVYKEAFNALAAILADFPSLLRNSTWIFVPGDNDPWASAFSAGASNLVPRDAVPDVFTSRIKRAFAEAKKETTFAKKEGEIDGEAIFTTNPARLSLFGPAHEVIVFRDEMAGRFRRSAVRVGQAVQSQAKGRSADAEIVTQQEQPQGDAEDVVMSGALPSVEDIQRSPQSSPPPPPVADEVSAEVNTRESSHDSYAIQQAKKLILTLLPQSTLSPFPLTTRPVHWDYASSALSLYPLPHTLILADPDMDAFAVTFEGCHCLNPGRLVDTRVGGRKEVKWIEYDLLSKRGLVRSAWVG
jgi:DNA polymerase epsilon subunit 2